MNTFMKFLGYVAEGEMWKVLTYFQHYSKGTILWRISNSEWWILDFKTQEFIPVFDDKNLEDRRNNELKHYIK